MPWKTGLHHDLQSEGIKYQHGKTYVKTKYFYIFLDEVLERCPWIYLKKTLIFQRQALSPETQRWVAKPSSQSLHAVSPGIATRKQDAILSEAQHVFSILNLPLQALIPAVVLADGYRTPVTLISQTPTLSKSLITPYPIQSNPIHTQHISTNIKAFKATFSAIRAAVSWADSTDSTDSIRLVRRSSWYHGIDDLPHQMPWLRCSLADLPWRQRPWEKLIDHVWTNRGS